MASRRSSNCRRRSHLASTASPITRRSPDNSARVAAKRPYAVHSFSPVNRDSAPHKWDIDAWRRGKKRRRVISSQDISIGFIHDLEQHGIPQPVVPMRLTFPASSADFDIFPKSDHSSRRRASYPSPRSDNGPPNTLDHAELTRLRSNAFWELRRSVAESGEGFVQRMRDYERTRSRQISELAHRDRRCGLNPQIIRNASHQPLSGLSDDDDDVHIFAEEIITPNSSAVLLGVPRQSLRQGGVIDFDGSRIASIIMPCPPSSLPYHLDSECFPIPIHTGSPASPSVFSSSSVSLSSFSSSVQSLPYDVESCSIPSLPSSPPSPSFIRHAHSSKSSEKAVSDLSLALANGAGSINDYHHLQSSASFQHVDGGDPGELWH